ncbi:MULTISPECIES: caspase family protein [unclassified Phyllobacterium]|uniref:caspase family protein n=1 Tax=unclassified Phyllobacterium TaxID=2638441 RepID=UPI003012C6D3
MSSHVQYISRLTSFALHVGAVLIALFFALQSAQAEILGLPVQKRIALIIGNADYQNVEKLENPANDAAGISDALRAQGFDIFPANNTTRAEFDRIFEDFKVQAKTADVSLVYFSGHGFQLNGTNYLVPVDAHLNDRTKIVEETISLDRIIAEVQSPDRQTLIFLDACRNNPLPGGGSVNAGLAQVTGGANVFIAFATQPGNISYDGASSYSPFTKALLDHINAPGQDISNMMIKVRADVFANTLEQQLPWDQSSLKKQFYFSRPVDGGEDQQTTIAMAAQPARGGQGLSRRTDLGSMIDPPAVGLTVAPPDAGAAPFPPAINPEIMPGNGLNPPVIYMPTAPAEIFGPEDLVWGLQQELQRLGCYTSDLDGVWGASSREALARYYSNRNLKVTDTAPTQFHYENLRRETNTVCVYVPPRQAVAPARNGPRAQVKPARAPRPATTSAPRQQIDAPARAAPPRKGLRDIGIGGVYR